MLKRVIASAAFAFCVVTSASAADMALKAPPPAPVLSWTGFYVGADVGGFWGRQAESFVQLPGFGAGGNVGYDPVSLGTKTISGATAAFHGGYNYQSSNWVAGVESSFTLFVPDGTTRTSTNLFSGGVIVPGVGCSVVTCNTLNMSNDPQWLVDLRGRLGYLVNNNTLIYGTGGVAWLRQNERGFLLPTFANISSISANPNRITAGWVAGGGLEYMLSQHWIVRGEYLFYSFEGDSNVAPCTRCVPGAFSGAGVFTYGRYDLQQVRFGASYKF